MAVFLQVRKIFSLANILQKQFKCNNFIQAKTQFQRCYTVQTFLFEPFWICLKRPDHSISKAIQQTVSMSSAVLKGELDESLHLNMDLAERFQKHVYANLNDPVDKIQSGLAIKRQLISVADNVQILLEEMQELEIILKGDDSLENTDAELVEIAAQDLSSSMLTLKEYLKEAAMLILPDHTFDSNSAVIEVRAGAGGNEASLFAEEIFNLYVGYSGEHFDVDITSIEKKERLNDGIVNATAVINGTGAFRFLKYECGVHRVQRVPKSTTGNKSDRLQTSTCSVAVLPLPDDTDYHIPEKDLKYEFVRSSGAGGQNVNKVDSACRVTHIPTGFSIKCQEQRTPSQNKTLALQKVRY